MQQKILENITPEDMPTENMQLVAEVCGVDTAINLLENMPGINVYVPCSGIKNLVNKYIIENYDGTRAGANKLALECKVSINHIYKLLKQKTEIEN